MMKRSASMIVIALASIVTPANASDWRLVELDRTKATAVEVSGIERSNGTAKAWTALMLPLTVSEMDYALTRSQFDCEKRTLRHLSVVTYDRSGRLLDRSDEIGPIVVSDESSSTRLMFQSVCVAEYQPDVNEGWPTVLSLLEAYRGSPDGSQTVERVVH